MRRRLLIGVLLSCMLPLWHAQAEEAIDNAAASIIASVEGKNDFHAHMARKLAAIAIHERRDRDREDAREFINMASQHAEQAQGQEEQESP
ncbi:MAG: hypothetical protein R8K46_10580 [Mariprofundaceae bacterium]